jgi:hypothetical protein
MSSTFATSTTPRLGHTAQRIVRRYIRTAWPDVTG